VRARDRTLASCRLLIVDEVGCLRLERHAANPLVALVSRRYERGSIIVTSNRGFEGSAGILGDAMVAAALIDRLVHHATMVTLKGESYRLRERGSDSTPRTPTQADDPLSKPRPGVADCAGSFTQPVHFRFPTLAHFQFPLTPAKPSEGSG
jgi:hypothetical protein